MKSLRTQIASVPDRENVVFEIWHGQHEVAEISYEPGQQLEIEIYPPPEEGSWKLNLDEFKALLDQGAQRLINF